MVDLFSQLQLISSTKNEICYLSFITRQNQETRLIQDGSCPLCKVGEETCLHLFKECDVVRVLWYGSRWNLRIDNWNTLSSFELVQQVIKPPTTVVPSKIPESHLQIMAAIILEQVWHLRNKFRFQSGQVNINLMLNTIQRKFQEHSKLIGSSHPSQICMDASCGRGCGYTCVQGHSCTHVRFHFPIRLDTDQFGSKQGLNWSDMGRNKC